MEKDKMIESVMDCIDGFDHKAVYSDFDVEKCAKKIIFKLFPEGAVVLTKEDLQKYAKDCVIGEVAGYDILQMAFARANRWREDARKETAKEVLQKFDDRLTEKFMKSADEQEMIHIARILRNVCPIKVHRVRKELAKEYGVEVE